jgi:hypothetical protein
MSATSNSAAPPASATGEGVRFWVVVAVVLVAVTACVFTFSGHVAYGAGEASLVRP